MAIRSTAVLARAVRAATAQQLAMTDADLLKQFAESHDQDAFATVINRHTAMVLAVCKRVLHVQQDAEDACQAVFVILAKKVRSVRWHSSAANWLFTTARKVAHNARLASERRTKREAKAAMPESTPSTDSVMNRELVAVLDEELDRLPPRYREPLVLCYLEGLTRDEAAARLGVPVATLKGQLERGRKKLGQALTARGCELGMVLLVTLAASSAGAFASQLSQSIQAAVGSSPSPAVAALVRGISMNGQFKLCLMGMAAVALIIGVGLGWNRAGQLGAQTNQNDRQRVAAKPGKSTATDGGSLVPGKVKILVLDADGKPMAGAIVRRLDQKQHESNFETVLGKTDATGRFEADETPFCTFTAVAEGIGAAWGGSGSTSGELTLKMATPLPIKGRLVDLQGKPIPNAKVEVLGIELTRNDDLTALYNAYRVNPEWTYDQQAVHLAAKATGAPRSTFTDADGRFELKEVGLRRVVQLRFEKDGIEAASIVVFADPEFAKRTKLPSDAERKMPSMGDDFRVATYGPEFTHAIRPDHVIAGTVMDAVTGKPIPGVTVAGTTSDLEGRFSSSAWHDKVESVTNADGRFRLRGLGKKKKRFLHFKGSDSAPYLDRLVEVKDTVSYDPAVADVKLQPAFVVEGRLINEATKKPVNGEVHWLPLNGNQPEKQLAYGVLYFGIIDARPSGTHAVAAADGRFRLRVPREPGVILARANQFDPTARFTPTHVRDADRRFLQKKDKNPDVIEAGPIRDRDDEEYFDTMQTNWPIRWENGYAIVIPDSKATSIAVEIGFNPGATVTLNVTDERGKPLSGVTLVGPGPYGVYPPTFAKPEIAVGGIDPKGRPVQLYLLHRERRLCAELVVKGDEKGPIAVSMRPCATVTGHVVDHSGKPVKDARVMFQMVDAVANDYVSQKLFRGNSEVRTDAGGKFSFSNMFPEQELDLFVNLPGFRSGAAPSKRVLMKPGEIRDAGEFRLLDPKKRDEE